MPGPPPAGSQFLLASSTTAHQVAAGAGGPAGRLSIALPRAGTEQYAILGTGNRQLSSCVPGDCPYVTHRLTCALCTVFAGRLPQGSPQASCVALQACCRSGHACSGAHLCPLHCSACKLRPAALASTGLTYLCSWRI